MHMYIHSCSPWFDTYLEQIAGLLLQIYQWIAGNHGLYHHIEGFPVNLPIIQFYESNLYESIIMPLQMLINQPASLGQT